MLHGSDFMFKKLNILDEKDLMADMLNTGFAKDINIEVLIGDKVVKADLSYDSYTNTTEVIIKDVPVSERICIKISFLLLIFVVVCGIIALQCSSASFLQGDKSCNI